MDKTSLGDRMKAYEKVSRTYLTRRTPLIIRVDGKAFHTLTRKMDKPYDEGFRLAMRNTAGFLAKNIMGCKLAYVQSDEISLLLTDWDKLETQPWYDKQVQKMASVSASMATYAFNKYFDELVDDSKKGIDYGLFDSRVFTLPKEEVTNYFIWRQQDATRNSIQGLGRAHFSQKKLHGKNCTQIVDLLYNNGVDWTKMDTYNKRGSCVVKEDVGFVYDEDIPIFTDDRDYIEQRMRFEEQ